MKMIQAVIRHFKVDDVKAALSEAGVQGMTMTEVRGFGRQKGHSETYRGTEYTVDFVPKIKVEVAVSDDKLADVMTALVEAARTGQVGDGKVFVYDINDAVRIRTGEAGDDAL